MRLRTGELNPLGNEPRRQINIGDHFGHLEVVERVERDGRHKGWRCRCHNERDGRPCGNLVFKLTQQLTKPGAFRACKQCSAEHMRAYRRSYIRQGYLSHIAAR
jgi:hypothetical protein